VELVGAQNLTHKVWHRSKTGERILDAELTWLIAGVFAQVRGEIGKEQVVQATTMK
jgi:hypothetical protein